MILGMNIRKDKNERKKERICHKIRYNSISDLTLIFLLFFYSLFNL